MKLVNLGDSRTQADRCLRACYSTISNYLAALLRALHWPWVRRYLHKDAAGTGATYSCFNFVAMLWLRHRSCCAHVVFIWYLDGWHGRGGNSAVRRHFTRYKTNM